MLLVLLSLLIQAGAWYSSALRDQVLDHAAARDEDLLTPTGSHASLKPLVAVHPPRIWHKCCRDFSIAMVSLANLALLAGLVFVDHLLRTGPRATLRPWATHRAVAVRCSPLAVIEL